MGRKPGLPRPETVPDPRAAIGANAFSRAAREVRNVVAGGSRRGLGRGDERGMALTRAVAGLGTIVDG
jgi:hypothetical protein